jgi:uncharacterized protein (DUF885 family)
VRSPSSEGPRNESLCGPASARTAFTTLRCSEVDRYNRMASVGQAVSYYLGEMTILRDRHRAEAALGPRFNLRTFHDTCCSSTRPRCR